MIYVIQAGDHRLFKIGYTKDAESAKARRSNLQTSNREKLHILVLRDGSHADEKALHRLLFDYRVRGEWFSDEADTGYYNLLDNVIELIERYGVAFVLDHPKNALEHWRPVCRSGSVFWRIDMGEMCRDFAELKARQKSPAESMAGLGL